MPHRLDATDVRLLLRLTGRIAVACPDPRRWRRLLLAELRRLLRADAGLALEMHPNGSPLTVRVEGFVDHGLAPRERRQAVLRELNGNTVSDPLLVALLKRIAHSEAASATFTRSELLSDEAWRRSAFAAHRRTAGCDDSLASLTRLSSPRRMVAVIFLRAGAGREPFGPRERTLLDLCHSELAWVYQAERRSLPQHANALPPRLREALEHLAAGRDEGETAEAMSLSPHTVHDYVKTLYAHFGVSSRGELLARWARRPNAAG